MSAQGHLETNGRKKRRVGAAAEDQEYQPPGTKRVRLRICSTIFALTVPSSVLRAAIPLEGNKRNLP